MRTSAANIACFQQNELEGMVVPFRNDRSSVIRETKSASFLHLTPRQLEVLLLLCEGLPNKLIARRLSISTATVKVHIGSILRELRVSSRLQAVVAARRAGLVSEPAADVLLQPDDSGSRRQSRLLRILLEEVSSHQSEPRESSPD